MKLTVGQIKQVIAEEVSRMDEATPFGGVTSAGRGSRRPRSVRSSFADDMDAPDPGSVAAADVKVGNAIGDARSALNAAIKAMAAFNPRWHRWVCRTPQGQEMSDVVIGLEKQLKGLTRELTSVSEARILRPDDLRRIVKEEVAALDEKSFLGMFKTPATNRRKSAIKSRGNRTVDTAPAKDPRAVSPAIAQVRTSISDMVHLYDTFTPKMRRKMCLGKAGDNLILALQNLDDMLGRI